MTARFAGQLFFVMAMKQMYGAITCVAGYRSIAEEQNQAYAEFDMKFRI